MMKFSVRVLLALFLGLLASSVCRASSPPYVPGETINYSIKQLGVKVGEASLMFAGEQELNGQQALLIVFSSKGPAFFDTERIFVDPATYRPIKVERDLKIFGGPEKITEYYEEGLVRIVKESDGQVSETALPAKGPIDNIYGFIYRYRTLDDAERDKEFTINLPTVTIDMQTVKQQDFNAGGQKYSSVLMKSVPAKYSIWFDTGEKRLPLRIAGAVGIANTVMTLVGVENAQ